MKKTLINLDIDETLIFTAMKDEITERQNPDMFTSDSDNIFFRPHVKKFLKYLSDNENIEYGIYTSSIKEYAEPIVEKLFEDLSPPIYIFCRDKCINHIKYNSGPYSSYSAEIIKDLKKVKNKTKYPYERIISIDDKLVYPRQRGNILKISEYKGEKNDNELIKMLDSIDFLQKQNNVRDFIKNYKLDKSKYKKNIYFKIS